MQRALDSRSPILAVASLILALLAATACQKASQPSPADSTQASNTNSQTAPQVASGADVPPAAPSKVQVCQLLSAAEVGAVMGRTLIQNGCSYGLDPAAKEKEMAAGQEQMAAASKHASAGDMSGFVKGMMQTQQKMGSTLGDQMEVDVDAHRENQTEDEAKAIYAKTSTTVRGAVAPLQPEQRGLNGLLQGHDEVSGVGDWAFATNVAAVNMGMGFSERGRILEARKGPWRVTVSATVGPDPGAEALDHKLAGVARALIAKLPAD